MISIYTYLKIIGTVKFYIPAKYKNSFVRSIDPLPSVFSPYRRHCLSPSKTKAKRTNRRENCVFHFGLSQIIIIVIPVPYKISATLPFSFANGGGRCWFTRVKGPGRWCGEVVVTDQGIYFIGTTSIRG